MNNTAMNIHVQVFCVVSLLLDIYIGVEVLGHVVIQCLTAELPDYFPKGLYHFILPHAVYESSNFSTNTYYLSFIIAFLSNVKWYLVFIYFT